MFSRAMLIQGAFEKVHNDKEVTIVEASREDSCLKNQFHTLGDIDKYSDTLLVEVSDNDN